MNSRKFRLTLITVAAVVALAVTSGLLKKFAGIDIGDVVKWAMVTIAGASLGGAATIAYEDSAKAKAPAPEKLHEQMLRQSGQIR